MSCLFCLFLRLSGCLFSTSISLNSSFFTILMQRCTPALLVDSIIYNGPCTVNVLKQSAIARQVCGTAVHCTCNSHYFHRRKIHSGISPLIHLHCGIHIHLVFLLQICLLYSTVRDCFSAFLALYHFCCCYSVCAINARL